MTETPTETHRGHTRASYEVKAGALHLDWSVDGAVLATITGRGAAEFAPLITERWSEAKRGRTHVTLLLDFSRMAGYDPGLRGGLTTWAAINRPRIREVHLIAESAVVLMGSNIANTMLGGLISVHRSVDSFAAAAAQVGFPAPSLGREVRGG